VRVVVEKVTLQRCFLQVPRYSLPASFQLSSILFLYLLPLKEGQMGLAWEPSKKECFSKIREHWIEAYFHVVCKGLREENRLKVPENGDDEDMWSEVRK